MKKIFTLFISVISVLSLSLCLSVTAFADTAEQSNPDFEEVTEIEKVDTGITHTQENPFTEIYQTVIDNADKILSALAFISSLVLMFFYKRGLLPSLSRSLSAIKSSAGDFEEIAREGALKTEQSLNFLLDKFAFFENTVNEVSSTVERLEAGIEKETEKASSREQLKTVMLSQVDLLYEIFMQSSLPQYSKDAVGEKVREMKRSLLIGEEND